MPTNMSWLEPHVMSFMRDLAHKCCHRRLIFFKNNLAIKCARIKVVGTKLSESGVGIESGGESKNRERELG